ISAASALVNNVPAGLMIQSINMDSNLYSAGLDKGDIITEINGKQITAASVALDIIDDSAASDKLTMKVYIASTKKYKTVSAVLLEDDSVSSYRTEAEQTTAQPFTFR
ncbi:MAG: PDZ domain-containing protein, partial [Acutalibacteraceae bacterium]